MSNALDIIIKGIQLALKFFNPATAFLGAIWGFGGLLMGIAGRIDDIMAKIDSIVVNISGSVDFTPLAVANYLFPLNQLLGYIVAYLALLAICSVIRMIKSFIPTIS